MVLGIAFARAESVLAQEQARPNIVVFLVDDMGVRDLSILGSPLYETPHIDALAREGRIFVNAYSSSPVCSPTRSAIMTGRNPAQTGITDWIPGFVPRGPVLLETPAIPDHLSREWPTLAEKLSAAGYATHFSGKWHLGERPEHLPQARGFDSNAGGYETGQPRGRGPDPENRRAYYAPYNNPQLADGPDGEFLTERLARESNAFMRENAARPFFLFHAFYQVHTPIDPAPTRLAQFEAKLRGTGADAAARREMRYGRDVAMEQHNAAYATMVSAVDDAVGAMLAQLDALGLRENTLIIFTSDNGGLSTFLSDGTSPTANEPFRGSKGWIYEGGIRVPLIVAGPGVARGISDDLSISTDVWPTLLGAAGLKVEEGAEGRDLRVQQQPARNLYWHFPHYHASAWRPGGAIRSGDWKLIEDFETGSVELFNLARDPGEYDNRASAEPAIARRLLRDLREWREQVGAKMPVPAN